LKVLEVIKLLEKKWLAADTDERRSSHLR